MEFNELKCNVQLKAKLNSRDIFINYYKIYWINSDYPNLSIKNCFDVLQCLFVWNDFKINKKETQILHCRQTFRKKVLLYSSSDQSPDVEYAKRSIINKIWQKN